MAFQNQAPVYYQRNKGGEIVSTHPGQREARMRWGTEKRGNAFDKKKKPYLSDRARTFIAQRAFCVVAGLGPYQEPQGQLIHAQPGFIQAIDPYTCLVPIGCQEATALVQGLHCMYGSGCVPQLALCFIRHATRERLCIQGIAELLPEHAPEVSVIRAVSHSLWIRLHVRHSFFHCPNHIQTQIPGLTIPARRSPGQQLFSDLSGVHTGTQKGLLEPMRSFIACQKACFICTVGQHGMPAVNHRGGTAGFLVALPPDQTAKLGRVLLPDYKGNGAFEAIGNILETGKAALFVPDYAAQVALNLSGAAHVIEMRDVSERLRLYYRGAERVIVVSVDHIEVQKGNWASFLVYEQARSSPAPTS